MIQGPRVYRTRLFWRRWEAVIPDKHLTRRCFTLRGARRWVNRET